MMSTVGKDGIQDLYEEFAMSKYVNAVHREANILLEVKCRRAEVDSLKEQNAQLERDVNDQSLELGELRPDAARYRYLRNRDIENDFPRDGLFIGCIPENVALSMEDADYAIDDAMVADSPQPSLTERQTDEQNRV